MQNNKPKQYLEIDKKTLWKRNAPQCYKASFTELGLNNLSKAYDDLRGLPHPVHNALQLRDSYDAFMMKRDLVEIEQYDGTYYMIAPNPSYFSINEDPQNTKHKEAGCGIVLWYIHPRQFAKSAFNSTDFDDVEAKLQTAQHAKHGMKRSNSQEKISDIKSASEDKYFASVWDLTPNDIGMLREYKANILKYLVKTLNVDLNTDNVNLYFHFPYAEDTVTLHLHARVNQGLHPLEKERSFMLDDVIAILESGKSMKQHILEKADFYIDLDGGSMLKSVDGISLEVIDNPFIVGNKVPNPMYTKHQEAQKAKLTNPTPSSFTARLESQIRELIEDGNPERADDTKSMLDIFNDKSDMKETRANGGITSKHRDRQNNNPLNSQKPIALSK